jgi:cell division protein FtsL
MKISLKSVLLFIAAMSVMLLLVYSTMEVSRINGEYHAAAQELQKLKAEEGILIRKAEASLSLSEVEAYAIGELGMVKPSREQFVYIGSPAYDHAEVVRTENFLGKAKQVFSSVGVRVVEFLD